MIPDSGLEFNKQWYAIANAGIGGPKPYVAPTLFTVTDGTVSKSGALEVAIAGSSYTDMMAATHRPLMPVFDPSHIYYSFSYEINLDPNAPTQGQALESEAVPTWTDKNGISWQLPGYFQINIEEKGMVQGFTIAEPWLDSGNRVQIPTPGTPYPVKISYMWNQVANTISLPGFKANGVKYAMPSAFQNVPALAKNTVPNVDTWQQGMYVQLQSDLASKGGSMTNKYTGIELNWE
jgi:hypothetical protein